MAAEDQRRGVAACDWRQDGDEDSDTWGTSCGRYFSLTEGDPFDNEMRYCCFCGLPLTVTPLVLTEDYELVYGETRRWEQATSPLH